MKLAAPSRVHRPFLSALVLVVALVAAMAPARAAEPTENEKQARTLYERAEKSFDVGKFADALTDYQAAYEAKPLPGFLFNIAQCYRNMGNFERARFFFRRYLTLEPRAPNRRKVDDLIAEMTKQLDEQKAAPATSPPPAPTPPPETTPAPAPEPKVETTPEPAPAPGPPPHLEAAPPVATTAPLEAAPAPAAPKRSVVGRWWFWTAVGVAVVGGAVAAFVLTRPETQTPGTLSPIDGR